MGFVVKTLLEFLRFNIISFLNEMVMKEMWNERFGSAEYVYGTEPNKEFKACIAALQPGKLLLLGEGEGRNAVHAAKQGWEVTAVDFSIEAQSKAYRLAEKEGVEINYIVSDVMVYTPLPEEFDMVALIYLHMPSEDFYQLVKRLKNALNPVGRLFITGFHKSQMQYSSGGPKNEDWLLCNEEFEEHLSEYNIVYNINMEQMMDQGLGHQGLGSIVICELDK